jgi:MFS family permease
VILAVVAFQVSQISNTYWTFFGRDTLGCSLDTIGRIAGLGSLVAIPSVLVIGALVDRLGPIPMVFGAAVFSTAVALAGFFHIRGDATLTVYGVLSAVGVVWTQQAMMPIYITLFPPSRYGQFCSAVNMMAMVAAIAGNGLMGVLMDWIGDYRWLLAWRGVSCGLMIPAAMMIWILYRRHGGPQAYRSPLVEAGSDEITAPPSAVQP